MNKHCGLPVIYLGNSVCQFVQEVKYLGVIIHSTIDFARQSRKFYLQANLVLRNFRHCSDDVKCVFFFRRIVLICHVVFACLNLKGWTSSDVRQTPKFYA